MEREVANLTTEQKKQIEEDVFEIIGDGPGDEAVVLDIESIHIKEPGKFEIDLVHLFDRKHPLIYKLEEGKYMIDIPSTFQLRKKN